MSSNVDFACHLVSSTKRSVGRDGDKERDAHGNIGLRLSHRHQPSASCRSGVHPCENLGHPVEEYRRIISRCQHSTSIVWQGKSDEVEYLRSLMTTPPAVSDYNELGWVPASVVVTLADIALWTVVNRSTG